MFIAHLFAGYLGTRHTIRRVPDRQHVSRNWKLYITFGVFCALLPDFDLLYFYTIDNRQHLHHSYWTHIPIFWVVFTGLLYSVSRWVFQKRIGVYCVIMFVNTWLHLLLDTVAGGIYWLYPWSDVNIQLFHISARYNWWVLNYLFHWTMLIEVSLILLAITMFLLDQKSQTIEVNANGSNKLE